MRGVGKSGAAALACSLVLLVGCVMPDQVSQVQKDLADVQQQLQKVEQQQASASQKLDALAARPQAEGGLSREDLADIDSRLSQASRESEITSERLNDLADRIERLAQDLMQTRQLAYDPNAPVAAESGLSDGSDRVPMALPGIPAAGGPSSSTDPEELYNTAYTDFSKGNYALAIAGFEDFYTRFPDSSVADNALYWIGECYFSQGNFPEAIGAFDRVLASYADSDKAAASDLKKGLAYLEQNQVSQAIVQLQHVRSAYSGSDEAKIATDKLTSLGAAGSSGSAPQGSP